jgi:DNA anti-recombination protein RmuC
MKNNNTILLLIILILLVVNLFQSKERIVIDNTGKIELIQKELGLLYKSNSQFNQKITSIDSNLQKVNSSIVLVQSNLQKIKTSTKQKIDSVEKFQYSDLIFFFNERYK